MFFIIIYPQRYAFRPIAGCVGDAPPPPIANMLKGPVPQSGLKMGFYEGFRSKRSIFFLKMGVLWGWVGSKGLLFGDSPPPPPHPPIESGYGPACIRIIFVFSKTFTLCMQKHIWLSVLSLQYKQLECAKIFWIILMYLCAISILVVWKSVNSPHSHILLVINPHN